MSLRLILCFYFFCFVNGNLERYLHLSGQKKYGGSKAFGLSNDNRRPQGVYKPPNYYTKHDEIAAPTVTANNPKQNPSADTLCYTATDVKKIVSNLLLHVKQNPDMVEVLLNNVQSIIDYESQFVDSKNVRTYNTINNFFTHEQNYGTNRYKNYPQCQEDFTIALNTAYNAFKNLDKFPLCIQAILGAENQGSPRPQQPGKINKANFINMHSKIQEGSLHDKINSLGYHFKKTPNAKIETVPITPKVTHWPNYNQILEKIQALPVKKNLFQNEMAQVSKSYQPSQLQVLSNSDKSLKKPLLQLWIGIKENKPTLTTGTNKMVATPVSNNSDDVLLRYDFYMKSDPDKCDTPLVKPYEAQTEIQSQFKQNDNSDDMMLYKQSQSHTYSQQSHSYSQVKVQPDEILLAKPYAKGSTTYNKLYAKPKLTSNSYISNQKNLVSLNQNLPTYNNPKQIQFDSQFKKFYVGNGRKTTNKVRNTGQQLNLRSIPNSNLNRKADTLSRSARVNANMAPSFPGVDLNNIYNYNNIFETLPENKPVTKSEVVRGMINLFKNNPDAIDTIHSVLREYKSVFKPEFLEFLFSLVNSQKYGILDSKSFIIIFSFLLQNQNNDIWTDENKQYLYYLLQPNEETNVIDTENLYLVLTIINAQDSYSFFIIQKILPQMKSIASDKRIVELIITILNVDERRRLKPDHLIILLSLIEPNDQGVILREQIDLCVSLLSWSLSSEYDTEEMDLLLAILNSKEGRIPEKAVDVILLLFQKTMSKEQMNLILNFLNPYAMGETHKSKRLDMALLIINNLDRISVDKLSSLLKSSYFAFSKITNLLLLLESEGVLIGPLFDNLITLMLEEQLRQVDEETVNRVLTLLQPTFREHPKITTEVLKTLHLVKRQNSRSRMSNVHSQRTLARDGPVEESQTLKSDWLVKLQELLRNDETAKTAEQKHDFVELTYIMKDKQNINFSKEYVTYAIPMVTFIPEAKRLLTEHPDLTNDPKKLLKELVILGNIMDSSSGLGIYSKDDIIRATVNNGVLVYGKFTDFSQDKYINFNEVLLHVQGVKSTAPTTGEFKVISMKVNPNNNVLTPTIYKPSSLNNIGIVPSNEGGNLILNEFLNRRKSATSDIANVEINDAPVNINDGLKTGHQIMETYTFNNTHELNKNQILQTFIFNNNTNDFNVTTIRRLLTSNGVVNENKNDSSTIQGELTDKTVNIGISVIPTEVNTENMELPNDLKDINHQYNYSTSNRQILSIPSNSTVVIAENLVSGNVTTNKDKESKV